MSDCQFSQNVPDPPSLFVHPPITRGSNPPPQKKIWMGNSMGNPKPKLKKSKNQKNPNPKNNQKSMKSKIRFIFWIFKFKIQLNQLFLIFHHIFFKKNIIQQNFEL
jgi:hypothetical protein